MLRKHIKFLTAASIDLSLVNHHLQKNKSGLETASSLCPWTSTSMALRSWLMLSLPTRDSGTEAKQPKARLSVKQGGYTCTSI